MHPPIAGCYAVLIEYVYEYLTIIIGIVFSSNKLWCPDV